MFKRLKEITGQTIEEKVGFTDHYLQEIYVSNDVHQDLIREALIHELLHVVLDDSGTNSLSNTKIPDFNETVISILSPRLLQVFVDNKDVLKDFFNSTP